MSEPRNTVSAGPTDRRLAPHDNTVRRTPAEGSAPDRRKDAGRRRKRSLAAFKDQHVLLIDQCEEVWSEHAPAGILCI